MRGVGGPLLCIGDLLSDVGDTSSADAGGDYLEPSSPSDSSAASPNSNVKDALFLQPSADLNQLFEQNYNQLKEALSETGHSWTALTLKLCSALETADKLIQSANSDAKSLSEKVGVLQNIVKRGDSAVKKANLINNTANNEKRSSSGS